MHGGGGPAVQPAVPGDGVRAAGTPQGPGERPWEVERAARGEALAVEAPEAGRHAQGPVLAGDRAGPVVRLPLAEEVGELAQAVRKGAHEDREHEFADVVAWVASLANQTGVDLDAALARYADGCPKCGDAPCRCA